MTDPIGDMLTRIRNANNLKRASVGMPASKLKAAIAQALQREGFIKDFKVEEEPGGKRSTLVVFLKYGPDGEKVISEIRRVSKPSCRLYRYAAEIQPVLNGFGSEIYTTNLGVLSDRECRQRNVGGEVLLRVS